MNRILFMKFKRTLKNKSGFTLIELIVVLAIMGIATSAILSMNLFGYKTFASGQNMAQKQFETRTAADFIIKQLRYASYVTFINSVPTPTEGYYDIYLDDGSIVFNNNGVKTTPTGLNNVSDFVLTFLPSINNVLHYTVGKTVNTNYNISSEVTVLNIPTQVFGFTTTPIGIRYKCNTSTPIVIPTPTYNDLDTMFFNTITAIDKTNSSTGCIFTTGAITGKMYVSTSKAVSFSGGMPINGDLSIDSDQSIDISTNGGNLGNNIILNSKGPISMHGSQFPLGNISITASSYSLSNAVINCTDFNVTTTNNTELNGGSGIIASNNIGVQSPIIKLDTALTYKNMLLNSNSITKSSWEPVNGAISGQAYSTSEIKYGDINMTKIRGSVIPPLPNNINVFNAKFDSNPPQIRTVVIAADYSEPNIIDNANRFFFNGPKTINYSFNDYGNLIIVCKGDLTLDSSFDRTRISGQKTVIYCTGNVTAYGKLNGLIISKNISGGGGFSIAGLQQGVKENDDFLSLAKAFITKYTQP